MPEQSPRRLKFLKDGLMDRFFAIMALSVLILSAGCVMRNTVVVPLGSKSHFKIIGKNGTSTFGSALTEKELGIRIYPGATRNTSRQSGLLMPAGSKVPAMAYAQFLTEDSVAQVANFYRGLAPAGSQQMDTPTMAVFRFDQASQGFSITISREQSGQTSLSIESHCLPYPQCLPQAPQKSP